MSEAHPEAEHSFDDTYSSKHDIFGHPYQELQDFFSKQKSRGSLLDVGSGQGRDALFLARLGYKVTAVDTSKVGIEQMLAKAKERGLEIKGIEADLIDFDIVRLYDVILFDMVLHAFEKDEQVELLKRYAKHVGENGFICIVFPDDIPRNHILPALKSMSGSWEMGEEVIIKDVPRLDDEKTDYTFVMVCVELK